MTASFLIGVTWGTILTLAASHHGYKRGFKMGREYERVIQLIRNGRSE